MERSIEIKFKLVLAVSFFIHVLIILTMIIPYYSDINLIDSIRKRYNNFQGRDIIVNINPDNKVKVSKSTLLSDKDSSGKGFITKEKGDNWLNNSLDYKLKKGNLQAGKTSSSSAEKKTDESDLITADNSHVEVSLLDKNINISSFIGQGGDSDWNKIPDKKGFSLKNSIYYTNDGKFSFNSKKFKDFQYFRRMKSKIAGNWFPPEGAIGILPRLNKKTGGYTPGRIRIQTVPPQIVKLYFTMYRSGKVKDVSIVETNGDSFLNKSCVNAIKDSKSFGNVPKDIPGEVIVIRFVFGYYVR